MGPRGHGPGSITGQPGSELKTAGRNIASGLSLRPPVWEAVRRRIIALVAAGNPGREDLLEMARSCILDELAGKIPGDYRTGAAFMGVTETTFKKWSSGPDRVGGDNNE
jgi:hypothetical protein